LTKLIAGVFEVPSAPVDTLPIEATPDELPRLLLLKMLSDFFEFYLVRILIFFNFPVENTDTLFTPSSF